MQNSLLALFKWRQQKRHESEDDQVWKRRWMSWRTERYRAASRRE